MKKFLLYCSECDTEFTFQHPSLNSLERLMAITLDCPNCETDLHFDDEAILRVPMMSMRKYMIRSLKAEGYEVDDETKIGFIQLGT
jgi:hypothetical protein